MPHLSFLFGFIVWAVLFTCSLCVDPQYEYCKNNQTCGTANFMFPFGVGNRNCGMPSFQPDCAQKQRPVIQIDNQNYTILQIFYDNQTFTITNDRIFQDCTFSYGIDTASNSGNKIFDIIDTHNTSITVYQCDRQCLPYGSYPPGYNLNASCSQRIVTVQEGTVQWSFAQERYQSCRNCMNSKGFCGYILPNEGDFFCFCQDGPNSNKCSHGTVGKRGVVIGVAVAMTVSLIVSAVFAVYYRKSRSTSDVEKFLHDYVHEMPSRYSYSRLKKITNNFLDKLGEGGFGVVYKGKLPSGEMVAVKILDQSRHSETQFMNEVATIGRIHHVHLVRLMGYCFEGMRSALVYEYMVNSSLDKFIFDGRGEERVLSWEQLYSIAVGAARGIAYLHDECNRRIIHFDIKPHNILLDAEFTPKIADFGLAKLCGRGDDHMSMTAARGTPGYAAPELWSRNVLPVTDKADVYSFGMLLLEMVGGRKNIDIRKSRSSQVYFPEWAFKLLENGEIEKMLRGGAGNTEMSLEDEEKARRMTKVGLWCIQHNSAERPAMSRVVQMLEGNGDDVASPLFPFDSSASTTIPLQVSSQEFSVIEFSSASD